MGKFAVTVLLALASSPATAKTDDVPPGYRAVALELPAHEWRYLDDKARVDYLVALEGDVAGKKRRLVATLLQNVMVTRPQAPEASGGNGTVRLWLNPNEAAYLALTSSGRHRYTLIARRPGDVELPPMEMAALEKIAGLRAGKRPSRGPAADGLIPEGERGVVLPLDSKTLATLKKGSRVDVYAAATGSRLLLGEDLLVLDVSPAGPDSPQGAARLAANAMAAQYLALASFEGLPLVFEPRRAR